MDDLQNSLKLLVARQVAAYVKNRSLAFRVVVSHVTAIAATRPLLNVFACAFCRSMVRKIFLLKLSRCHVSGCATFMVASPPPSLCLLLNRLHLFSLTGHRFILIQTVPLHACYMFRPLLKSFSDMSMQNSCKGRFFKLKGLLVKYIIIIIIIIIILGISLMQCIYTYIPETNQVPRKHCVATIPM
jgi:hypothetical protein